MSFGSPWVYLGCDQGVTRGVTRMSSIISIESPDLCPSVHLRRTLLLLLSPDVMLRVSMACVQPSWPHHSMQMLWGFCCQCTFIHAVRASDAHVLAPT